MGLPRTFSKINYDISRKSKNFSNRCIFHPDLRISAWYQTTRVMGLPRRTRNLTISSVICI